MNMSDCSIYALKGRVSKLHDFHLIFVMFYVDLLLESEFSGP